VRLPNASLVMHASYTDHLRLPSGSVTVNCAVLHTAKIVSRDSGTRQGAGQRLLKCRSIFGAHHVVQDRVHSGAEVVEAAAQRIQPVVNIVEGRHLIRVQ